MRSFTYLLFILFTIPVQSKLCFDWKVVEDYLEVDSDIIYESSGLSSSWDFSGQRFYHINDSGSGASFHISYTKGKKLDSLLVKGGSADDLESVDVGPCLETKNDRKDEGCIYLADIGDNDYERNNLKIFVLAEKDNYKHSRAKIKLQLNVSYRDGYHNAEALMVHPHSGDIFIITKRSHPDFKTARSILPRIYRLKRETIIEKSKHRDEIDVVFDYIGSIELDELVSFSSKKKYLVTDADFSPDGSKFALLTLGGILEFNSIVLNENYLEVLSKDYNLIANAPVLDQQEAITYSSDGKSLVYTSEKKDKNEKKSDPTKLLKLVCKD